MKVLVVDDSKPITMMVSGYLGEAGHQALVAYNGQEAVDLLKGGEKVDLILLDWNMPVMGGLDFLKLNQSESFTSAPIVMMTTESKMEIISQSISLGAREYIMKPFTADILLEKIHMVLG